MKTEDELFTIFQEFIEHDQLPYYFYIHDKEGKMIYISGNITALLGLSSEDFKNDYISYATANPLNREMIKYTMRALKGEEQEPYQVEMYDKGYTPHLLLIKEKPLYEGGEIIGIQGVAKLIN